MQGRLRGIVTFALAAALLGTLAAGGVGRAQSGISAPLTPLGGSTGTGTVSLGFVDATASVYLIYGRPNAAYEVSACQSNTALGSTACYNFGQQGYVYSDASGTINGLAMLPKIGGVDAVLLQNVLDPTDAFDAVTGPNGSFLGALSQPLGATVLPSSVAPQVCPPGFSGTVPVAIAPLGTPALVLCP